MQSWFWLYVVNKEGAEVFLCRCESPAVLADVLRQLASLGVDGPIGYRITRVEESD